MDIAVSADGVVDDAQRKALAEQGCHEIQGQQYGAPVDAQGALNMVAAAPALGRRAARQG